MKNNPAISQARRGPETPFGKKCRGCVILIENQKLGEENIILRRENENFRAENDKLREELEKLRRSGKRQAAPFSKDKKKKDPKKPGRKRGKDYGERPFRPLPEEVDRVIGVPVSTGVVDKDGFPVCPDCQVRLSGHEREPQYQVDIPPPPAPIVTRFDVETAGCPRCGRRFQGRHPEQASDALHAAGNQLGPRLIALAMILKYEFGMSFEKIKRFLADHYGVQVGRATLARAARRLARKGEPTYEHLIESMRESDNVGVDETGWRIGGDPAWLWVFTNESLTVYVIDRRRSHEVVEMVLGEEFGGTMTTDGYPAYDPVKAKANRQCNAHLVKARRQIEIMKTRGAVRFSREAASVLRAGIDLHRRREKLTPLEFGEERGKIEAAMDRLLEKNLTDPDNARLARRLKKHRDQIFTYLHDEPGATAPTNNEAEGEIRPAVITRKCGGCNRSEEGARATYKITSIFRTSRKRGGDAEEIAADLLRGRDPFVHPFFLTNEQIPP